MKRTLLIFLLLFLILFGTILLSVNLIRSSISTTIQDSQEVTQILNQKPTVAKAENPNITFDGRNYAYDLFLAQAEQITLIENTKREASESLAREFQCTTYTSGGFYTESHTPLGLFIVDGVQRYPAHNSSTLNGFFWIGADNSVGISSTLPDNKLQIALQAGPLLIENESTNDLAIVRDTQERRSVIGLTKSNQLFFLIIYDPQSVYLGPYLVNLPLLVKKIAAQENVTLVSALNLDGGTASVFRSKEKFLSEFKVVGSLICVK